MNYLKRITERVTKLGHPGDRKTPRPLLTIDEFFEGNESLGSIGCNIESEPPPRRFYELLKRIALKPSVRDIRVKITEFDNPDWPFSDTVYVITSESPETVASWFDEDLKPDQVWEGFVETEKYEPYDIPAGTRPIACWWD